MQTITVKDFADGKYKKKEVPMFGHFLKAVMIDGGIVVHDTRNKKRVHVEFAGTKDNRTCYAYKIGLGFIGGWQCTRKPKSFSDLVQCINAGIIYQDMNDLPERR